MNELYQKDIDTTERIANNNKSTLKCIFPWPGPCRTTKINSQSPVVGTRNCFPLINFPCCRTFNFEVCDSLTKLSFSLTEHVSGKLITKQYGTMQKMHLSLSHWQFIKKHSAERPNTSGTR